MLNGAELVRPQISKQLASKQPSEEQISKEEVQSPCRFELRDPNRPRSQSDRSTHSSSEQHRPSALRTLLALLLILSNFVLLQ